MTQVIPYEPKYPIHTKSPKAVLLLNLFPGLGNLYAEGMKGFIWLVAAGAALYLFPNIMTWLLAYAIVTARGYKAAQKHNSLIAEGKLPESLKKSVQGLSADQIKKQAEKAEKELGPKLTEYSVLVTFIEILKGLQVKVEGTIGIFEKKADEIIHGEPDPAARRPEPSATPAAPAVQEPAAVAPPDTIPAPLEESAPTPTFALPGNVGPSPEPKPEESYTQPQVPEFQTAAPSMEEPRPAFAPSPYPMSEGILNAGANTEQPSKTGGKFCIECGAPRDPNFSFCIACGAGSVSQT